MKKTFTLMRARQRDRRHLLRGAVAAAGSAMLAGCDSRSQPASIAEPAAATAPRSRPRRSRCAARIRVKVFFMAGPPSWRGPRESRTSR